MELRLTYCMQVLGFLCREAGQELNLPAGLKSRRFMYNRRQSCSRADCSGLCAPLVVAASVVGRIVSRHHRIAAGIAVAGRRWRQAGNDPIRHSIVVGRQVVAWVTMRRQSRGIS